LFTTDTINDIMDLVKIHAECLKVANKFNATSFWSTYSSVSYLYVLHMLKI